MAPGQSRSLSPSRLVALSLVPAYPSTLAPRAFTLQAMRPALLFPVILLLAGASRAGTVIEREMHHLRWGEGREWAEFPAEAEGGGVRRFRSTPAPATRSGRSGCGTGT